jgi:hypothetical protein
MIRVKNALIIAVVSSFIAGSFVASPELRTYAANTVGSADIINNTIQSLDIKDGEVKTVDLGGNAVTSAKIKDGEVKTKDIAQGAVNSEKIAANSITTHAIAEDAVAGSELISVDKFVFATCNPSSPALVNPGKGLAVECAVDGMGPGDSIIATANGNGDNNCFAVYNAKWVRDPDIARVILVNGCTNSAILGQAQISIISYRVG